MGCGKDFLKLSVLASLISHMQPVCQEWTENSACEIKCIEVHTLDSNKFNCMAVDSKTALGTWTGNVSCTSKSCGVPPSLANTLQTLWNDTTWTLSPTIANLGII